jgi:hypothetical protein
MFMAGKIAMVAELIKSNPDMVKKDLVALVVKELGVPKQNAYVYIFNANKKLAKGDVPKAVKAAKVRMPSKMAEAVASAASKTAKSKNLEMMKRVSASHREEARLAKRAELQPVIDQMLDDSQEYVNSLTAPVRKFIAGAE